MEKKMTKKDYFVTLVDLVNDAKNAGFVNYDFDSILTFIDGEMALLDKKVIAARVRAEKKKAEGDALRDTIQEMLNTENYATIAEIVAAINNEEVSQQKVAARLTQLVKAGVAVKDTVNVKTEDGKQRKLMGYKLA